MVSLQEKIRRRRASIKCDVIHNLLLVVHNMNAIVQIILLVNNEKTTTTSSYHSFIVIVTQQMYYNLRKGKNPNLTFAMANCRSHRVEHSL